MRRGTGNQQDNPNPRKHENKGNRLPPALTPVPPLTPERKELPNNPSHDLTSPSPRIDYNQQQEQRRRTMIALAIALTVQIALGVLFYKNLR